MTPRIGTALRGLLPLTLLVSLGCPPTQPINTPASCSSLAETLVLLEPVLDAKQPVALARVEGCTLELLPDCKTSASYVPVAAPSSIPRILIANEVELKKTLPLDAATLGGKVGNGSVLIVEPQVVTEAAAEREPARSEGGGACTRATHYVDRMLLGFVAVTDRLGGEPVAVEQAKGKTQTESEPPAAAPVVVAFSLRPLGASGACTEGTVWDGRACVGGPCPLGTVPHEGGCASGSISLPKDAPPRARAQALLSALRDADPERRVAILSELSTLYHPNETHARALVYANLTNDQDIADACAAAAASAARLDRRRRAPPHVRMPSLAAPGEPPAAPPEPAPATVPPPAQPAWCDQVARMLAAYAALLEGARQLDAATEINLRLIREHPKSDASAPAFRSAAEKLCRDGRVGEANRLYEYIRVNFKESPVAKSLSNDPCPAPPAAGD